MKRKTLLLSLLALLPLSTAWASVEINETNFPDESFRSWVNRQYGSDGLLSDVEIQSATNIVITSAYDIKNLKGIEYFTEVKSLSYIHHQLTSLDVSKNTALTSLYCYQNRIQGTAMDALVQSLPHASDAEMYVISNENEQNVMTVAQVEAAKAKGWIPYYTDGEKDENGTVIWKEYAGSDPSDISSVNPDTDDSAVWYDLLGRRMSGKPSKKGLYVKDGKKILVK